MAFDTERIRQEDFSTAIQNSYAEYGVSSNARAIPDARDGLKPVQRRILWFMYRMGWDASHDTVKSAEVVGTVMGQAHPHGQDAIYDAAVRLAQDFSLRYPLIEGQGNFGSDDDDPAAAMRYTEMRLSRIGEIMLADIGKDTVPLAPTYKQDPRVLEPYYLPARVPPAVNGQDGVGLGFATRVPPHNLREMLNACIALLDRPQMTVLELMQLVKGPDFPTGGTVVGEEGIREYLATGRGRIVHRGTVRLEEDQRGRRLIVTEVPFVGRANVKTSIARAFNEGKLPGLSFEGHIPDESSDQNGTRIVLPLRRDAQPSEVLAQLYQSTTLQTSFSVQMTFLFGLENEPARTPRTVGMVELLRRYNEHQLNVLRRRSQYDLARARERLHLVEGLIVGAVNADEIVRIFQAARDRAVAREQIIRRFKLSELQAQRISDMTLAQVTRMDLASYRAEKKDLQASIARLEDLLAHEPKMVALLKEEMQRVASEFGDARRTVVLGDEHAAQPVAEIKSAIESKPVLVALSVDSGLKAMPSNTYAGKSNAGTVRGDERLLAVERAATTDYLLCQLSSGRVATVRVARLPETTRAGRAELARSYVSLDPGERVVALVPVSAFSEEVFLVVFSREGKVKKTALSEYLRVDEKGAPDFRLLGKDGVARALLSPGGGDYLVTTSDGKTLRFADADLRPTGRVGQGVQAIGLARDAVVVGADWVSDHDDRTLWVASSSGMLKRSPASEYPRKGRATGGVATIQLQARSTVVGAAVLSDNEDALLISSTGRTARAVPEQVPLVARDRKGSPAIRLEAGDSLVRMVVLPT
ncbi:MAG: DNA topoisomerase [Chloroflexota bacterium]|nr:DNA topoisomerase [Chloroflexota bacterium]